MYGRCYENKAFLPRFGLKGSGSGSHGLGLGGRRVHSSPVNVMLAKGISPVVFSSESKPTTEFDKTCNRILGILAKMRQTIGGGTV